MKRTERRGFSLVELLVVIGIITMLIALLLPALLSVLEDSKQLECKNNIKQHVAAITQFVLKKGRYPGYADTRQVDSGLGAPMTIDVGWAPQLFPYLDMEDRMRDFQERCAVARDPNDPDSPRRWIENVKLFVCPSDPPDFDTTTCATDPNPKNFVIRYPLSYAVNGGKADDLAAVPPNSPDTRQFAIFHDYRDLHDGERVTGNGPKKVGAKITDIKDGAGNTLLVTENADLVNWTSAVSLPNGAVEFHQAVVISRLYDPTLDPSQQQGNIASAQQDQFPDTSGIGLNYGLLAPDTCATDTTANKHVLYGQLMSSTLNFRNARPSSFHQDGFVVGYADGHVDLFFVEDPKSTDDYGRFCREITPAGRD
jgi:prepilin-type N-terminal cleavage/methylation domain-containing protein